MASMSASPASAAKPLFAQVRYCSSPPPFGPTYKANSAQIAAAGLKPPSASSSQSQTQQTSNSTLPKNEQISQSTSKESASMTENDKTRALTSTTTAEKLPAASKETALEASHADGPQVIVHNVDASGQQSDQTLSRRSTAPISSDEVATQTSSSDGSMKPQSLDGKSVTSGATFALDEKESLRPDDSASVQAIEDEDVFSPLGSGIAASRPGSDFGASAFRHQLREISAMDSPRHNGVPVVYSATAAPKGVLYVPPQGPGAGSLPAVARLVPVPIPTTEIMPDPKLLEALDNPRDRVWVLKLEQDVIDFVKDATETSLNLPQCNSFYRMLAHKMADYYMLGHVVDDSSAVRLFKTPNCRIPPGLTGITTPSTAASTPPPSAPLRKILRRGDPDGLGNGAPLWSNAENGEANPEEKPKPVSREEREARYEAARLRIMGSAKPSDSPEVPKEKQDSRSSSATGKKGKKKARNDSDDDFEARSAYSNYFAAPMSLRTDGIDMSVECQQFSPVAYHQQNPNGPSFAIPGQVSNGQWSQQAYQHNDQSQSWSQGQQQHAYDLAAEFQRYMPFQNSTQQGNSQNAGFSPGGGQQYFESQVPWSQPQYQSQAQTPPAQYGPGTSYMPSPTQTQEAQHSYAFGQLPSQAFPGRTPNRLEHPLPGSYKSRHFNPQSQTFVPGHTNGNNVRPFTPQGPPPSSGGNAGFSSPFHPQLQRQNSTPSQASVYNGQQFVNHSSPTSSARPQSRQLTHPLPQRVLARQSSPGMAPLPPKPGSMPAKPLSEHYRSPMASPSLYHNQNPLQGSSVSLQSPSGPSLPQQQQQQQQQHSVIAMYGSPSSLPPKPPPSHVPLVGSTGSGGPLDLFDPSKLPLNKRPSFGTAPPIMTSRQSLSGSSNGPNSNVGVSGGYQRVPGPSYQQPPPGM
jgi:hypothetical protein